MLEYSQCGRPGYGRSDSLINERSSCKTAKRTTKRMTADDMVQKGAKEHFLANVRD